MPSKVQTAIRIITEQGGEITDYDLLEALGYDPTANKNTIKKLVFNLRRKFVKYDGGVISLDLDKLDGEGISEVIEDLSRGLEKKERFYGQARFVWGLVVGLVVGFLLALQFSYVEVVLDTDDLIQLINAQSCN